MEHDEDAGLYWYEVAAASGNLEAALKTALFYGVKHDFLTAQAYVDHVLAHGDDHMIDEAHAVMDQLRMMKEGRRLPI